MPKCVLCNNETATSVCGPCSRTTGVREMTPARRRAAPCVRCNHTTLIRVIPRELSVHPSDNVTIAAYAPMTATYPVVTTTRGFFPEEFIAAPTPLDGLGVFECYICKKCGFVDWFCQDPENIPIGPQFMTEEVDVDGGPYR